MTSPNGICIASDEDVETGYMLVNAATPASADERLAMFVLLAAREWDVVYDPRKIGTLRAEPLPVVDDPENESWRPPEEGEEPTHRWYVFTDLYEAQMRYCASAAGTLTEELVLRLVDVADVLATVETDEDGEIAEAHTAGLLSALDYGLRGSSGCMEPDEWQERRRQALAKHGVYLGLGEPA